LQEISTTVADYFGLHFRRLISSDRSRTVSKARAAISYLAVDRAGYTQAEVGEYLNIRRIGVRNSILWAEKMACVMKLTTICAEYSLFTRSFMPFAV
jgi:hypothetical protein